jgi:hypothetical protein
MTQVITNARDRLEEDGSDWMVLGSGAAAMMLTVAVGLVSAGAGSLGFDPRGASLATALEGCLLGVLWLSMTPALANVHHSDLSSLMDVAEKLLRWFEK